MFSIYAQTQASLTQRTEQTAMERLSTGERINHAKDDANGIAMHGEMNAQIDALYQGLQNANDGVSMVQVADGAMDQVTGVLQRMRELALQGASGTLSGVNYGTLQSEFSGLQDEILSVIQNTKFNEQAILNRPVGTVDTIGFHVGNDGAGAVTQGQFLGFAADSIIKSGVSVSGVDGDIRGRFTGEGVSGVAGSTEALTVSSDQLFTIDVDGITSGGITLVGGTKQKGEWATEIQNQINADSTLSAASKSVTVAYNSTTDKYEIDSDSLGVTSTVNMVGAASALGLHPFYGTSSQENISAVSGYYEGFEMAGNAGGTENSSLSQDSTFTVLVDGVISSSINLTPSSATTQSKTDWAAALQSAINSEATLVAASKSVTVAYDTAKDAFIMSSDSGGASSRVVVTAATESMATLGIAESGKAVELISLEGVVATDRQLTFSVDGTAQPQITLPATTKTVAEWAAELESMVSGVAVSYDVDSKQYIIQSDKEGYGSTVSFMGDVPKLGLTSAGETQNGYNNINEILLNHYDLDDSSHALGTLLLNTQSIASQIDASAMLAKIDSALGFSHEVRGHYGAVQNRLETVASYMEEVKVNQTDARSKINDTDFAAESAELAKLDILKQVTTAMMAQANQLPKQMLQLFK